MLKLYKPQRLLTFILFINIIATALTSLNAQWEGWDWQQPVTITNSSGSVLTEFQVKISLNSANFDFSHAKSDGSDLRVTDSDQITEIPFWVEEWDAIGESATIWVKVPNIPTTGATVYFYYGNNSATSKSNGLLTFRFFDDFELWNVGGGSTGWVDITSTPTPAKADNTVAVFNGKLYVFGGYGNNSNDYLDEVFEYDPGTNAWTTKTDMPTARWGMVSVEFNGLIYVFGGQGTANNKNEVYNPANDTWDVSKATVPANLAQQGLMGVKYGDKIHLFYRSYHYEYDPATDLYTQKANVPEQLTWGTCATVGSKIYIIGGFSYSQSPNEASNNTYEYDPVTNTWTTKMSMPVSLYGVTRENPVINGKIYVTHGHAGTPFFVTNYVYDPGTNTWEQKGSAAHPRDGVGCGVIDNKLYVIGGRDVASNPYGVAWAEVYDPLADTELWSTSGTSYVYTDASAKYQGNYGLVIRQTLNVNTRRYAQSIAGFGAVYALDFNWNVTSLGGVGGSGSGTRPETRVRLTELPERNGDLFFYNVGTTQVLRWYTGSAFNHLQNSTRDSWHKVTLVRNGTDSRVIFDVNPYQSPLITSPGTQGTGKFMFDLIWSSTMYLDNVRVRSYVATEPTTTVGTEIENPLPVELSSFSASVIGSQINLRWMTETEVSNYGFDIERASSSTSPVQGWTKIGFVEGNGNSNSPKYYSFEDNNLIAGKYSYRLKQIDTDGQFEYSKVIEVDLGAPMKYELSQNYPNPFNPVTTIQFSIPQAGDVKLTIYNILGEQVAELVNENKEAGVYTINFNATELNSGLYIYKLTTGNFSAVKKLMVIK